MLSVFDKACGSWGPKSESSSARSRSLPADACSDVAGIRRVAITTFFKRASGSDREVLDVLRSHSLSTVDSYGRDKAGDLALFNECSVLGRHGIWSPTLDGLFSHEFVERRRFRDSAVSIVHARPSNYFHQHLHLVTIASRQECFHFSSSGGSELVKDQ